MKLFVWNDVPVYGVVVAFAADGDEAVRLAVGGGVDPDDVAGAAILGREPQVFSTPTAGVLAGSGRPKPHPRHGSRSAAAVAKADADR